MGEVKLSKTVFFIGAWRTQMVTDHLLQQISSQLKTKKGFSTTLTLTSDGLELLIHNQSGQVTRTDKIPLQNIIDFIGSKYSKTSIHAIVKDRNQLTVFVFLCSSERDAGDMVQTFGMIKKRLSGEGYNLHLTPKGTNWMLKTKGNDDSDNVHHVSGVTVEKTEKILINGNNTEGRLGEVRVLANGDVRHVVSDDGSRKSSGSDLKDELIHLSDEVKAIKLMLEKNQPQTAYRVQQQEYKVVRQPLYENTVYPNTDPGDSHVVYHYETMADQPSIKHQTIYTKNQRYGGRRGQESGAGGYYVMRGRTDTGHSQARSNVSVAQSTKSFFSKRRYDSPNPMANKQVTMKQMAKKYPSSMRVVTKTSEPNEIYKKYALRKTVSSDTVVKNIEDVYKNRISFRKHAAMPVIINRPATEYVSASQVFPPSKQSSMKLVVSPPPDLQVKPMQREIVEKVIEVKNGSEKGGSVARQSGLYVNTTGLNSVFIEPERQEQRVYTVESSEKLDEDVDDQHSTQVLEGGDVIVIKAETMGDSNIQSGYQIVQDDSTRSSYTKSHRDSPGIEGQDGYEVRYSNQDDHETDEKVIHIKAEGAGQIRYVRDYEEVEVIDTRTDEEKNEAEQHNENGDSSKHIIIREEHIKPPSEFQGLRNSLELYGEHNSEVRRITKNDKRVHYMEELNQTIGDRRDSDIEVKAAFEGYDEVLGMENDDNYDDNDDVEVDYIMDTERFKEFTKEPDIVIIEQEVKVSDKDHQNVISEKDLRRTEDTVLF